MKKILKDKRMLYGLIVLISVIGLSIFLILTNDDKTKKEIKNYVAYIKINPLIKVNYSVMCIENKCTEPEVKSYELITEDAKKIYDKYNLISENRTLYGTIDKIAKVANNNNVEVGSITIYSDWKKINYYLENYKDYNFIINIRDSKDLKNIEESLKENIELYNVTFNTDGGSEILGQSVKAGENIEKPEDPAKPGYKFIGWQVDGKLFDFETKVNEDITLVARWEPEEGTDTFYETIDKIEINNLNEQYKVESEFLKNGVLLAISGNEKEVNKINIGNISLYIDLKNLNVGTHEVTVFIAAEENDKVTFKVVPEKITVKIYDKNDESAVATVTKINLNDNVEYVVRSGCSGWQYVNPMCMNKSLDELKMLFPDYDKKLDDKYLIEEQMTKDSYDTCMKENADNPDKCQYLLDHMYDYKTNKITYKNIHGQNLEDFEYLGGCLGSVPNPTLNELKAYKGLTYSFDEKGKGQFYYVIFKDEKYTGATNYGDLDFTKYSIVSTNWCDGTDGSEEIQYKVLDETACKEYNLSCDRW